MARPAKSAKAKPRAKAKAKSAAKKKPSRDALAKASHAVMDAVWSKWGKLEHDVISHLINPSFMGGPRWPGMRQAYRVARAGRAVLIASDGLSDPFDAGFGPQGTNGVGLELFAVTDDDITRPGDGVMQYGATWLHQLVLQAANLAASQGTLADLVDEYGVLSSELYDVAIPQAHAARYVTGEGCVGVLLAPGFGALPARVDGPLGPIRLVRVQLLTREELAYAVDGGAAARKVLAKKLAKLPTRLARKSVV